MANSVSSVVVSTGLVQPLKKMVEVSQESVYRTGSGLLMLSNRYGQGRDQKAGDVWAQAGYVQTAFMNGETLHEVALRAGAEGHLDVGSQSVARLGTLLEFRQGHASESAMSTHYTFTQQALRAGLYTSFAQGGAFVGAFAGYERIAQKLESLNLKRHLNAVQASLEAGYKIPLINSASLTPEVQVQYTRFFKGTFQGHLDKIAFDGGTNPAESLKTRLGLRLDKDQQLGDVALHFYTRFSLVREAKGAQEFHGALLQDQGSSMEYRHHFIESTFVADAGLSAQVNDHFGFRLSATRATVLQNEAAQFSVSAGMNLKF